jgi:predicted Zn-dependent peptidase
MNTTQTNFVVGMGSLTWTDNRIYILNVLSCILGGGFGSLLFQILRNEKGLVYGINTSNIPFIDGGLFTISSGVDNKNFLSALRETIKVLKDFKKGNFDDKDIKRAKEYIKAGMGETYETVDSIAYSLSSGELLSKEILSLKEKQRRVDLVSKDDILHLFSDIFKDLYISAVTTFDNYDIVLDIISDVY